MHRSPGQQEGAAAGFPTPLPTVLASDNLRHSALAFGRLINYQRMPHAETYLDLSKTAWDILANFLALLKDR